MESDGFGHDLCVFGVPRRAVCVPKMLKASPALRLHTACYIVPAAGNHSLLTPVALPGAQNKKQVAFRTPEAANHSFTRSVHYLQYDVTVRMQPGARRQARTGLHWKATRVL